MHPVKGLEMRQHSFGKSLTRKERQTSSPCLEFAGDTLFIYEQHLFVSIPVMKVSNIVLKAIAVDLLQDKIMAYFSYCFLNE